jgi:hypothetical protein
MKYKVLFLFSVIAVLVNGQAKTSLGLNINYPLFDNKDNTLVNSIARTSLFEEVLYSEKPGISIIATHEMAFLYETFISFGLGLDWLNYELEFNETNVVSQNKYVRVLYNPLIEKYNAIDPAFSTTVLYASIPVNIKYPIFGGDVNVLAGFITNIQLINNQKVDYIEYFDTNNQTIIKQKTVDTDEGINKLLLLVNFGCEYNLNNDLAITFDYKIGITPLYKSNYIFVENSALNLFNLGVKYCFLK